ncbi:MAG: CBS domain-containing protein, partial [Candidatus Hydrothermarchaeales archaeon]
MPLEIDPVTAKMSWEIMKLRMREQVRVRDVMRRNIMSIDSNMPVEEAAELMIRSNAQCIAVKEDGEISGMINERDLVKAIRDPRKSVGNISSPPLTVNIDTSLLDVV